MFKFSFDHIAEDFNIIMFVRCKAPARFHDILVDNAKSAKAHLIRIKIVSKGKGVAAVQPSYFRLSTGLRAAFYDDCL